MGEIFYQKGFKLTTGGGPSFFSQEAGLTERSFNRQFDSLRSVIEARPMWQGKPSGKPLYLDLRGGVKARKMAGRGWQTEERILENKLGQLSRIPALILVTRPINFKTGENLDKVDSVLHLLGNSLQKNASPLFVVEYKGQDLSKQPRLDFMSQWGLINTHVLVRPGHQRMVWEGREEKQRENKGVNLINGAKEKGNYLHNIAMGVKKFYEEAGFKVVNWDEIHQLLLNSRYPLGDIEKLKNGWGVRLESNQCGCLFDINLDGEVVNHHSCSQSWCSVKGKVEQGSLAGKKERKKYKLDHQFELVEKSGCRGCGGDVVRYMVEEKHGKKTSRLLINTYCSSCSKEIKVERKWVDNQDIIRE